MDKFKNALALPLLLILFLVKTTLSGTAGFFRSISNGLDAVARKIDPSDGWV